MGEDAARERLIDRAVQDLLERLVLVFVQILPDPVEDDDRVVQGVAHHREHRGHHGQAYFQPHDANEHDGRQDVVRGRTDGREPEAPLEAVGEVGQNREKGKEYRQERFLPQLPTHLGADRLGP